MIAQLAERNLGKVEVPSSILGQGFLNMAEFKCPGSDKFRQPVPEQVKCPICKEEVEIWTDETKADCPECRIEVKREMQQNCLDWCKYARECIGEDAYKKYLGNKQTKYNK